MRQPLYVNVYLEQQCYGGPEEGGWYYNAGFPALDGKEQGATTFYNPRNAWEYAGWLNTQFEGQHDPYVARCYQRELTARVESHPARPFPQRRPYYC